MGPWHPILLSPPVWRRVLIPESITLTRLHGVI
ncbi:hypothetical protein CBM2585_A130043 [Cupriavidus taiwanensis]|nr:hypothetical protein CBM2585_A130043 [Cupriavidus taiwanensis]